VVERDGTGTCAGHDDKHRASFPGADDHLALRLPAAVIVMISALLQPRNQVFT
jgi:hypothetical protein